MSTSNVGGANKFNTSLMPATQRKRYCKIKTCKNAAGMGPDVFCFQVPQNGRLRDKWIHAISEHQEYEYDCLKYLLCNLHFDPAFVLIKNGRKSLREGTVPTIFQPPVQNGVFQIKQEEELDINEFENYEYNLDDFTHSVNDTTENYFHFDTTQIKQERDSENEEERDIQFEVELIPNPAFAKPKHRSSRRVTETAQMYTMQVEKPSRSPETEITVYVTDPSSTSPENVTIDIVPNNSFQPIDPPRPPPARILNLATTSTQSTKNEFQGCKKCAQMDVDQIRLTLKIGRLQEKLKCKDQKLKELRTALQYQRTQRQNLQQVLDMYTGQKNISPQHALRLYRMHQLEKQKKTS